MSRRIRLLWIYFRKTGRSAAAVIPLYEVLETVNRVCHFSDTFEAARLDHGRERPVANLFLAGVIGLGCNLTTQRVAKTAKNISAATLETTVRNYRSGGPV